MTMRDQAGTKSMIKPLLAVCVVVGAAAGGAAMFLSGCDSDDDGSSGGSPATSAEIEALRPQITAFCGGCHTVPDPASFPKDSWHHEVEKAYRFFHDSDRRDLKPLPMNSVVKWFREQAPEKLTLAQSNSSPSPLRFRRESIDIDSPQDQSPSISGVFFQTGPLFNPETPAQPYGLFCDMQNGSLGQIAMMNDSPVAAVRKPDVLQNPARVELADLDGNQKVDYVISELGSFPPGDHENGKVLWYRPDAPAEQQVSVLLDGVGRIADARAADFDGDGDQDLVVAEFGWIKTGGIHYLEQVERVDGVPRFKPRVIDKRHGTIHVAVADLDKDGDSDFVALISQEYEEVTAFLNTGDGTFEQQTILPGGDPAFGSGGIELVDLDGDDDLDVLYVNGDSLDSNLLKPYHSVQWLENEGDFPFMYHLINRVPGVCRAVAGDLDGDGDLDIAAGAWVPPKNLVPSADADGLFDTVMWFEQSRPGEFQRHSLTRAGSLGCMAADIGDLNGDGNPDILIGKFGTEGAGAAVGIDVYWNLGPDQGRPPAN